MDSAESIKEQLQAELAKASSDPQRVADLTDRLLDLSEDSVRFTVDAHHINRLGLELVGKQETALSELIKNAYDADATTVQVTFKNFKRPGGELIIKDDGSGMDASVIKQTWMRLSTTDKENNPISPKFGRNRAGKKGIGRFAVQRLGTRLTLETEVEGVDHGIRVKFDWDGEFTPGKSLTNIWSNVEAYDKPLEAHGTALRIHKLRDKWMEATIGRVWKSVLFLQPPFKLSKLDDKSVNADGFHQADPGFKVTINGDIGGVETRKFSLEKNFLEYAVANIHGKISDDGSAIFKVTSKKLGISETYEAEEKYLVTGPLSIEARYFIYGVTTVPGVTQQQVAELGREYGGIRIYRSGFRVLPYGERGDDWLRLAEDMGRRNLLVPANNYHFFGHVEVDREQNPLLEETSSREGFIENEAFHELQKFARSCVEWAAMRVAAIRERKTTASQKDFVSKFRKPTQILDELIVKLEDKKSLSSDGGDPAGGTGEFLKAARDAAQDYEDKVDADREASLRYEGMLRILASLGLSIGMFGHEIKGASNAVHTNLSLFNKAVEMNSTTADLIARSSAIKGAVARLFDLGGYISNLMTHTESRELNTASIRGIVETFTSQFSEYMSKQGISFETHVEPPHLRTCPIHRSEMDSVLFNLLTNAIKAMKKAKQGAPKILINAYEEDQFVVLRFEDNGTGVGEEHAEHIFGAFYTTTEQVPDDIAGPGTGLGLKIVSDIASVYGGNVRLVPPSDGYTTCFEFRILHAGAGNQ